MFKLINSVAKRYYSVFSSKDFNRPIYRIPEVTYEFKKSYNKIQESQNIYRENLKKHCDGYIYNVIHKKLSDKPTILNLLKDKIQNREIFLRIDVLKLDKNSNMEEVTQ